MLFSEIRSKGLWMKILSDLHVHLLPLAFSIMLLLVPGSVIRHGFRLQLGFQDLQNLVIMLMAKADTACLKA
jgi:hypothetical protein